MVDMGRVESGGWVLLFPYFRWERTRRMDSFMAWMDMWNIQEIPQLRRGYGYGETQRGL